MFLPPRRIQNLQFQFHRDIRTLLLKTFTISWLGIYETGNDKQSQRIRTIDIYHTLVKVVSLLQLDDISKRKVLQL
jgi:hypothetical protein